MDTASTPGPLGPTKTELATSSFFALVSRMRYIERWSLMRSSRTENLAEHSLDVAIVAHALCTIGNVRYGRRLDASKAALVGLFHDASEIITGDMPTPVKYANGTLRDAYKAVEAQANQTLLDKLPADLRGSYQEILVGTANPHRDDSCAVDPEDEYLARLVKAADKISALVKCVDELRSGNDEFATAEVSTRAAVDQMAADLPEVADFMSEFMPAFGRTLDQLL